MASRSSNRAACQKQKVHWTNLNTRLQANWEYRYQTGTTET